MKPTSALTDGALEALQQRGIDPDQALRLGVVSAQPTRGDKTGDEREWLAFPHRETSGGPTHWQFRTLTGDKDFKTSVGTSDQRTFFNAEVLTDPSLADVTPIITEGQLDTLALMTTGFVRVVSVPDGAPPPGETVTVGGKRKYAYLDRFKEILDRQKEIILAVDDDAGGHALRRDLVARLGPERCKWVTYGGCKDANDLLISAGPSAVLSAIEHAKWVQLDGLYQNIDDVPPLPESEALSFNIHGLDRLWRLQRGTLSVLVGIPSHGKTSLLNDCLTEFVKENAGSVVCFASLEQYPQPQHRDNLRRCFVRDDPAKVSEQKIRDADEWIREHFLFIVPARDEPPTFDWLIDRAKMAALRSNASVLVIDPWNELAHEHRPPDIPMHEYIGVMLRKLRRFAQEYHVAVIVAVHPTKMMRDKDGKSPIPTGYDIADSANWVNKADVELTIYRRTKDRTVIRNWKSRNQPQLGEPGEAVFCFYQSYNRFVFVGDGDDA